MSRCEVETARRAVKSLARYEVHDGRLVVLVVRVGRRRDVYQP